jgi:hypothetical protein
MMCRSRCCTCVCVCVCVCLGVLHAQLEVHADQDLHKNYATLPMRMACRRVCVFGRGTHTHVQRAHIHVLGSGVSGSEKPWGVGDSFEH